MIAKRRKKNILRETFGTLKFKKSAQKMKDELREEFMTKKFVAIERDKGLLLKALPKDPVKALEKEGKKLPKGTTLKEMKDEIEKLAVRSI